MGGTEDAEERRDASPQGKAMRRLYTEVVKLKASSVKYDRFLATLGVAATVIVSAAWKVTVDAVNRLERAHIENMHAFRDDVQKELDRATLYSRASYAVTVEQQSPALVAKEVRAATADAGTPEKPHKGEAKP